MSFKRILNYSLLLAWAKDIFQWFISRGLSNILVQKSRVCWTNLTGVKVKLNKQELFKKAIAV